MRSLSFNTSTAKPHLQNSPVQPTNPACLAVPSPQIVRPICCSVAPEACRIPNNKSAGRGGVPCDADGVTKRAPFRHDVSRHAGAGIPFGGSATCTVSAKMACWGPLHNDDQSVTGASQIAGSHLKLLQKAVTSRAGLVASQHTWSDDNGTDDTLTQHT